MSIRPKMATDIPPAITVPDMIESRIGTLRFTDGFPDDATVERVYDHLDFLNAVQAFMVAMPAASLAAMRAGLLSIGVNNGAVAIYEDLMDARSLLLTANTESVYVVGWLDLKDGPIVVETPPNVLAFVNDFWFHYVCDMGNAGPDHGQGGKTLILPPDYDGEVPEAEYFVSRSATYGNWLVLRGFLVNGEPDPAVESIKSHFRLYPYAQAANPPETTFINASGMDFNTIHAMDASFYDEVDQVVQEELAEAIDPETLGLLLSIGMRKGSPFKPDERMRAILKDAAGVGSATSRAIGYRTRAKEARLFTGSKWLSAFYIGDYQFLDGGARALEARTQFFFQATGITPAMAIARAGIGSQYGAVWVDSDDRPFNGSKSYQLHLPPDIPVKDFWSIVAYDTQTRSLLQTDQRSPSTGSQKRGLIVNDDGSVDVYFGPEPPAGKEPNWIQTIPGKGWFAILRLYGPLQPWFDRVWRPGEIEAV